LSLREAYNSFLRILYVRILQTLLRLSLLPQLLSQQSISQGRG
jgi:hypothetical protein